MTRMIGIAGKKHSGKNTCCNYLHGLKLKDLEMIEDFSINQQGKLQVFTTHTKTGERGWGELHVDSRDISYMEYAYENIWPHIKIYSFADALKHILVSLFQIEHSAVYGSEEEKNQPTHLLWENMPGVVTNNDVWEHLHSGDYVYEENKYGLIFHEPGPMTGREVMQYFGTDIMRRMYEPVWVNNTLNSIAKEGPEIAIIPDVRFPNEFDAIVNNGGEVIKLTRGVYEDNHVSENLLDPDNFDQNRFTYLIDNANISMEDLLSKLSDIYHKKGE